MTRRSGPSASIAEDRCHAERARRKVHWSCSRVVCDSQAAWPVYGHGSIDQAELVTVWELDRLSMNPSKRHAPKRMPVRIDMKFVELEHVIQESNC